MRETEVIKTLVWQTVDRVCTPSRAVKPWEAFRPEFVRATAQWRRAGTSLPAEETDVQDEIAAPPGSSEHSSSSLPSSSSSKESSAVSEAPQLTAAQFAEWGHSAGASTMVHFLTGNSRIMPACARGTTATVFGVGLADAEGTQRTICSHCLKRLGLRRGEAILE